MSHEPIIIKTTRREIRATYVPGACRVNLDISSSDSSRLVFSDLTYEQAHELADWIKENVPARPPIVLPTKPGTVVEVNGGGNFPIGVWMLFRGQVWRSRTNTEMTAQEFTEFIELDPTRTIKVVYEP